MYFWVGILLLISAGSFVYVATIHILPEVYGDKGHDHDHHVDLSTTMAEYANVPQDESIDEVSDKKELLKRAIQKHKAKEDPNHYSRGVELAAILIGITLPFLAYTVDE